MHTKRVCIHMVPLSRFTSSIGLACAHRPPQTHPMPPWRPPALSALVAALAAAVFASLVAAAPEGPKPQLAHTLFDNLPSKVTYFEDSPVRPRRPLRRTRGRARRDGEQVGRVFVEEGGARLAGSVDLQVRVCEAASLSRARTRPCDVPWAFGRMACRELSAVRRRRAALRNLETA